MVFLFAVCTTPQGIRRPFSNNMELHVCVTLKLLAMKLLIICQKIDVSVWTSSRRDSPLFDSRKRPSPLKRLLNLRILGGPLRQVRMYNCYQG